MTEKKFRSFKPWLILILFLLGWSLIPTLFKSVTRLSLYELQAPVFTLNSQLEDLQYFWSLRNHSKTNLIEAGRDLARLNASYELKSTENKVLKEELSRLESLLDLPKLPEYDYMIARISRRNLHAWNHQLTIRKGYKHGVPQGAAVINRHGVVGRVKEVHAYSSIVELLSSPTFRVAARFLGDNRPITYRGSESTALTSPKGEVHNIPNDIVINPQSPLTLVSSQLGGVFPDGLTIGSLAHLEQGNDGLFKQGKVLLGKHLHELREVAILIPSNSSIDNEA